jgi:HEAT repeat protein
MEEQERVTAKINLLVKNAGQMKVHQFREGLETLVKEGEEEEEEEIEFLLTQFLNDTGLTPEIRMEIIRTAGQLQHSSFLVPLKKIIDTAQHSRIRQEAIAAVAKFNDRRALNILTQAQEKINNPLLQRAINEEINRIKENNPILALLPRFQEGQKNPKTYRSALQVLKNILTPGDATIFTKFLTSQDPLLQKGAFEILCTSGDIFHDAEIVEFYHQRSRDIPCRQEPECEELYLLTDHIKLYLSRYQFLIEEQVPFLKETFQAVKDLRVRQLLLSLLCKSREKASITFIKNIYHQESATELKTTIIKELSGNDAAADFLFELYRREEKADKLKETIVQSLLNIKQGLDYFVQHFFSLGFADQELIVQHLPYAGQHDLVEFIKKIFQADVYRLKELLLAKVKETYEFSVKDLLFAPEGEREFHFMGDEYFDTIIQLFPVTAVKKLLEKMSSPNVSVNKAKKYLLKISEVIQHELIFNLEDKKFITTLFTAVIKSNNTELNTLFLGIVKSIKTLSPRTYHNLRESINLFITRRETKLTPREKGELSRIKNSLKDLYYDIEKIEQSTAVLGRFLKREVVDFDFLREVVTYHHLAVVKYTKPVVAYLSEQLRKAPRSTLEKWIEFLTEFPGIAGLLITAIEAKAGKQQDLLYRQLDQVTESLDPHPLRIVINCKNRGLTAILREQFQEAAPQILLVINDTQLKPADILLCDPEMLRDMTLQTRMLPEKIYLFLEKSAGFAEFKAYNTRNIVQPFVFYRIVKEILQRLYLQ